MSAQHFETLFRSSMFTVNDIIVQIVYLDFKLDIFGGAGDTMKNSTSGGKWNLTFDGTGLA